MRLPALSCPPFSLDAVTIDDVPRQATKLQEAFSQYGIVRLSQYATPRALAQLCAEMLVAETLAEAELAKCWSGEKVYFRSSNPRRPPTGHVDHAQTAYFLGSSHKTRVFYEDRPGAAAVNRIGHGLHLDPRLPRVAGAVYGHARLHHALQLLGYRRPICHLSVYIPKLPDQIGSDVRPHQESTFAYTEPQSVVVLWLALEDTVVANACMWGIAGSHQWPLKYRSHVDPISKQRRFEQLNEQAIPDFDPANPAFSPLEVKAGDALLFHGRFVHCSPQNVSSQSRRALTFQFIETDDTAYPASNWLHPLNERPLY